MIELLAVLVLGSLAWAAFTASTGRRGDRRVYRLSFPRGLKPEHVVGLSRGLGGLLPPWWERLTGVSPSVVFEVRSTSDGIEHLLMADAADAEYVLSQVWAALPGVRIQELKNDPRSDATDALELRLASSGAELRVDRPETISAGILATLQPLRPGEELVVQWVVTPTTPRALRPDSAQGVRLLLDGNPEPRWSVEQAAERAKQSEPPLLAVGRIGVRADDADRSRHLARRVLGAIHLGTAPSASFRRRLTPSVVATSRINQAAAPLLRWPAALNARELAAHLAIPTGDLQLPGLRTGGARVLAPAPEIPSRGRAVGCSTFPGAERSLALSVEDSLRHLHVIGPTGTGKSTLLLNLILRDIAAGRGVALVDPKGDLVEDVLDRLPERRISDVVLLDPSDEERPVGLNLLAASSPELAADQVVAIFRHLYSAFWGPRTDDVLRAALLTLGSERGMTLAEVPVLLTDERLRRRLVGRLDDHVLEGFWGWYEALSDGERAQVVGPVLNKLRVFLLRKRLRNVIGQSESTFDMASVLSDRKILLVALRKGVLGEDAAALLGSTVVSMLWQAVQARAVLPQRDRRPFFAFVDEFQDYTALPTSFADVLAQARAYGLGMTLAHQHLAQLPAAMREAVLANARSRVVFQTSARDGRALAREFAPYLTAEDLLGLGAFEAVFAAAAGEAVAPPATIATAPAPAATGTAERARGFSRQRYGKPASDVEAAMRGRTEGSRHTEPIGTRRRS